MVLDQSPCRTVSRFHCWSENSSERSFKRILESFRESRETQRILEVLESTNNPVLLQ